ncbi:MAG: serine/threonine-protein kinase [Kofleriaceae bacterium]
MTAGSTPHLEPGTQLGRYRLIAPLGHGGMGGVWRVADAEGREYALKSPAGGMNPAAEPVKRFAREANAVRMLDHPNLVQAVVVFVEDGFLFLVMELVEGVTLTKELAKGPLAARRALVITRQLLDGIAHAHAQGLVHRDLKPENIMLIDMGGWERAKIVDFGLVKLVGDAEAAMGGAKLTSTGIVFGTPAYMSPEQALGRAVDGRADIYALATMLFEMLVGKVPFDHPDPMMQMRMQVKAPPPRLDMYAKHQPWCTPQLVALVEGALIKEPDERFPSATVMMSALDDAFLSIDHVP